MRLISQRFEPLTEEEDMAVDNAFQNCIQASSLNHSASREIMKSKFNVDLLKKNICTLDTRWNNVAQEYRGSWLDDEVINFYAKMLKERDDALSVAGRRKSHFFNSNFMIKLRDSGKPSTYDYGNVKRWASKVDLLEMDRIYCPINIDNGHWTLLVIFVQEKKIRYYDSMGNYANKFERYSEAALNYMRDKHLQLHRPFDVNEWRLSNTQHVPRQANGYDCGVFTIMFMDFLTDRLPFIFSQDDILLCRRKICASILRGSLKYT